MLLKKLKLELKLLYIFFIWLFIVVSITTGITAFIYGLRNTTQQLYAGYYSSLFAYQMAIMLSGIIAAVLGLFFMARNILGPNIAKKLLRLNILSSALISEITLIKIERVLKQKESIEIEYDLIRNNTKLKIAKELLSNLNNKEISKKLKLNLKEVAALRNFHEKK